MKILIQRSLNSKVISDGELTGEIQKGMVLFICFEKNDDESSIIKSIDKALLLRIFEDEQGKMNKNILESGGEILAISQFTLSWNGQKGNRPSFDNSMPPELASKMFQKFIKLLSEKIKVESGIFASDMKVHIINDGPVTIFLDF